ncbi:MAG: adenylyl-sulfate kinase [Thermoplasmata archaeon]
MDPKPSGNGFGRWLAGLPSAGMTTISRGLAPPLMALGWRVGLLDGDEVGKGPREDLGFDRAPPERYARGVTFVTRSPGCHGVIPNVALISPYASLRAQARHQIGRFGDVFSRTPIEVCEPPEGKELDQRSREGGVHDFTGVDDPYEPPDHPEIVAATPCTPADSAIHVIPGLGGLDWLTPPEPVRSVLSNRKH